jgi:putative cell wall-binding protein
VVRSARRLLLPIALVLGLLAVPDARGSATVDRQAGASRYETAIAIADLTHPNGASTAVVASGVGYADALAAGVAASALRAPLLLASDDFVPTAAIESLGVERIVLVGGTAALSDTVARRLAATGATIDRVAGANRFETATMLANSTLAQAATTVTLRASGESFPSALVAAVHASRIGGRLELAPGLAPDLLIVDGERLRGTPGELNLALLARFPASGDIAIVSTISSFPDALTASALAGTLGAAVLFTERHSATQTAIDTMELFDPVSVIVIGGTAAVSERVLQQLFGFVPLPPVVPAGTEAAIARDVFDRANDERAERGLPALQWDAALSADARTWAEEMSRTGYRHGQLVASVGENIHMVVGTCDATTCTLPTSGHVHRSWMGSQGNRDNLLEVGYVIGGVGAYCGPDGTLWAVARFGIGYGGITAGGSGAEPVVHDDATGLDCSGARSG